ncbi:MAG: FAD:protein FMN transferase [Caldilineaceae bacterium]|nr:FAD:protein FMN transferase [Caldilineaceae bacterium]
MKPHNPPELHIRRFRAMGTEVELQLWNTDKQRADNALSLAERFFRQSEARLSRFRPHSELSRLNQAAGEPFHASQTLYDLVQSALAWRETTGGIFDPTLLHNLIAWGYDRTFTDITAAQADGHAPAVPPARARPPVAPAVQLGDQRQITLPAGVGLDLGGIAKGWTIQQAAYRLHRWGPCLIDAGGDIACLGKPPAGPWLVPVEDPLEPELDIAVLSLTDQAVATSSRAYRRWMQGDSPAHHLLDPRTGAPAETTVLSATVAGERLPDVEIHAKTALILGEEAGLAYLNQLSDVYGILVTEDGRHLLSNTFEEHAYVSSGNYADRFRRPI